MNFTARFSGFGKQIGLFAIGLAIWAILYSTFHWGIIYAHSMGEAANSRGDAASARFILKIPADLGYAPSKATLGMLYLTGAGGPVDARLARGYLLAAAEDGFVDAQVLYGMALYSGKTLPLDRERGIFWLRKAAEQGDFGARNFLRMFDKQ